VKKPMPKKPGGMPPIGDSVASGNRMSKENAKDLKAVKKYAKGGKVKPIDIDMKGLEEASRPTEGLPKADLASRVGPGKDYSSGPSSKSAPAKKQSFSQAFAAARKSGATTFKWNGGTYGTKLKGEDSKPAASKPAASKPAASKPAASKPAAAKPAAAKPTAATKTAVKTAPKEDPMITVTGKRIRPNKPAASDPVSKTTVGKAINRGVGSIQSQMNTQSRNMAKMREKNPDIFTRIMRGYAKGGKAKKRYV